MVEPNVHIQSGPAGEGMTETRENNEVVIEALAIIDKGLSEMTHRDLVSTVEVSDLLLDVRLLLDTEEVGEVVASN